MSLQCILKGYTLRGEHQIKWLPWEGFQEFSVSAFDKTEIGTATTGLRWSVHLRRGCVAPSPSPQEYTTQQSCLLDFHLVANQYRHFTEEHSGGV
jgi:hypothetical protein